MSESRQSLNPIRYFTGRLLQLLRHERGIRNATALAERIGVSPSTYRLIEAGRQPVPAWCALRLAQALDLPVRSTAATIAIAQSLSDAGDDPKLLAAQCAALARSDPALRWMVAALREWQALDATRASAQRRLATEESILMRLRAALAGGTTRSAEPRAATGIPDPFLAERIAQLSPFHWDALSVWLEHQTTSTPVLPIVRQLEWLALRAGRVVAIRSLVCDPLGVAPILSRETMVLELVRNPNEPQLRIAIAPEHRDLLERHIRARLRTGAEQHLQLDDRSRAHRQRAIDANILIRAADDTFTKALDAIRDAPLPGNAQVLSGRRGARLMRDLWVVDYRTIDLRPTVRRVGFMCLYERLPDGTPAGTGYAIAFDAALTEECVRRFDAAWPPS